MTTEIAEAVEALRRASTKLSDMPITTIFFPTPAQGGQSVHIQDVAKQIQDGAVDSDDLAELLYYLADMME